MAVKFRLIDRKNLGKDAGEAPRKLYAQAVNNGYVTFDELCEDISENCTLTSADVKAVMDRMNFTLDKHLRAGRIVQFGEIGNFRMSVGSSGAAEEKEFHATQIRKPKIVFTPGGRLQTARRLTTFEKDTPRVVTETVTEECDRPHMD
jgi:predicted histone-like DNA-binding protein